MENLIAQFVSNGNGDGRGRGYGNGNGHGNGAGHGAGNGNGYGNGNGHGNGAGHGNGNGCGNGHSNGNGCGNGYGIKSINGMRIYFIDNMPTIISSVFGNVAKGHILENNVYLKPCYIVKSNEYFAHGATLREAQMSLEDKIYSNMEVGEVIAEFREKFSLGAEYPASEFYHWHHRLTGSCEMGRKSFATSHGIDIDSDKMTVERFIDLTKNSYGAAVIRQLEAAYKEARKD